MTATLPTESLSRRDQILQALAHMLETSPGQPITTARLAKVVGVSEAALYRHFPSKAKMFEGLIEFIEDTLFSRVSRILEEERSAIPQCEALLTLLLAFAERNPGMCRILIGDALAGEVERLRSRVAQVFDRLETQLKQIIREAEIREGLKATLTATQAANLMLALAEGRINQFVRSEFRRKPTEDWTPQWRVLVEAVFRKA
ncbi:nucleoid occlusion factor SlmA [bacterium]|nr:nucleoid occlusion factor SlmA [bacterium]